MAKIILPYTVNNRLPELIQQRAEKEGKFKIGKIEKELSEYCGLTFNKQGIPEAIKKYKNGSVIPSLPVALRISEFFGTSIENIWELKEV